MLALAAGSPAVQAQALLSPEAQASLAARVREAVETGGGGARILAGRRVTSLTPREAQRQALERNLSVQIQKQIAAEARTVAQRSASAFDPVTTLGGSYARSTSRERSEIITRLRRPTPDFEEFQRRFLEELERGESGTPGAPVATCSVAVDGQPVLNGADSGLAECTPTVSAQREFASSASFKARESYALFLRNSKLFGYGGFVSLSLDSTYSPRLTPFVSINSTDVANIDPTWAYASTLSLGFTTPLPFGRNFGPYGTQQARDLRLAELQVARSRFEYESVANSALLAVDNAYSDLVGALMVLQIALEQKQVLEQLRRRSERFFDLGEVNRYAFDQVDARLAATLGREALAWNQFAAASEALANLLNRDLTELLLPADYQQFLERTPAVDAGQALEAALTRNVDVKRSEFLVEEARAALEHRITDTRPDVLLNAGLVLGQSNRFFGYEDLGSSLRNVFSHDTRTASIGVAVRIPLGNAAAKAALGQARVGVLQTQDRLTESRTQAVQRLSAALDTLQSAQKQIEISRLNMRLAEDAFDSATRRRNLNLLSEFERLEVQNDLLNARLNYVDALVQHRKNAAQFLASQHLLLGSIE